MALIVLSSTANVPEDGGIEAERSETLKTLAVLPQKELMVSAYLGAPYTYSSDVTFKKPGTHDFTIEDIGWDGEPFKSPIYYGARIASWFAAGRTAAMLDFTHSKALGRLKEEASFSGILDGKPAPPRAIIRDIFRKLEFSHGHNMLTLNGLLRLANLHPRISPYIGLGAGITLPHTEVQMKSEPRRTYEYQYAGPVAQALIGLEFRLPRTSYFLEYKFTLAPYEAPLSQRNGGWLFGDLWRQFKRWSSGEPPPGGFVSTTLTSHQVIFGIGARFAAAPAVSP